MTELLPCPFCGSEARIFELTWTDGLCVPHDFKHPYYRVVCQGGCRTLKGDYDTEAEAIAAWNSRTERVDERETINKTGDIVAHDAHADDYKQAAEYWQRMYEETFAERTCKNISGVPLKFRCSECGDVWGNPSVDEFKFCPNCGAKVVGE